ncbi:DUF4215 domain-containing protein [Myxococcus sp. K15C18031901]|uniref:EGF domain-containing protein n=1 Tax=Myxococcus dinghuensis TaxID=2906761 RepID=UPI0020A6F645|nr:EGF domain-containing protein [Myxococcus dinghuensis]MCP3102316.1 DUF4215 domain-containing protein [Myxococcus dinghuensis]
MKVSRVATEWRLLFAAVAISILGACGVSPEGEDGLPVNESAAELRDEAKPEELAVADPYAKAVAQGGVTAVLNPQNAVGAPDGNVATMLAVLGGSLVLDMGTDQGTGPLRIYYRGLSVALIATVEFLRADMSIIATGQAQLLDLGLGDFSTLVPYTNSTPYRYVRLRGGLLSIYMVDAVEATGPLCGDGRVTGSEQCDDGNRTSGDGCSSTCQVETGFTCQGQPSVCTDINECANGTAQCSVNATCTNTRGSYTCACKGGYTGNGRTCNDINECTNGTATCSPNGTCTNTPGSYSCTCNAGYSGNGRTCTDVNECTNGTATCSANATCSNTQGSYTCACKAGYTGNGRTCNDINECTNGTATCSSNGTCTNTPGSYTCACKPGYAGDGRTCTDVNECTNGTSQCSANATCSNTQGSYSCTCKSGYTGNGRTCNDVNECTNGTATCSANATCSNTQGSYTCACKAGYSGDGRTCNDINECTNGTATCQPGQRCVNRAGGYDCVPGSCPAPLVLCGSLCVNANTDTTNCGCCGNRCGAGKTCSAGTCKSPLSEEGSVGGGDEGFIVRMPTGMLIDYGHEGLSAGEGAEADGRTLEVVGWGIDGEPPMGTYDLCRKSVSLEPAQAQAGDDLASYPLRVTLPDGGERVLTGRVIDASAGVSCSPEHPSYVGSITLEPMPQ